MDEHRDAATDDPDLPAAGDADGSPAPSPVPPSRRSWFDRPLFWLGLVGVGVVLAVVLSFAVERTDLSGSVGDVGHYCQQVRNVKQLTSVSALGGGSDGVAQARRRWSSSSSPSRRLPPSRCTTMSPRCARRPKRCRPA